MYYRLLAYKFLPEELIESYLDPDILVINPIRELYDTDLEGYFTRSHHDLIAVKKINRIRLYPYKSIHISTRAYCAEFEAPKKNH